MHRIAQQTTVAHVKNEPRSAPGARGVSLSPMFYRMIRRIIESKFHCSLRVRAYSHPEQRSGLNFLWNTISLRTSTFSKRTKWESPPTNFADIKEAMSRTLVAAVNTRDTLVRARFFVKFGTDLLLNKDARSKMITSYKQARNFSKLLFENDTIWIEIQNDDWWMWICFLLHRLITTTAIIVILSFLE